jgi:lysophospholipase L1-like esterase
LSNALLLAFALVLSGVVAEKLLRVFELAPSAGVATMTESDFLRLPGIFAPSQQVHDRRVPALAHTVTIDSLGYRGYDFPRTKADGQFRLFVLGDSFVYGDFVDDEETLPALLQTELSSSCEDVLVVNAGLGGSSITEELAMAERALGLSPDYVLLVFTENDITDLARLPLWESLAENRRSKSRFPLSVVYPILRNTAVWHLALQARAKQINRGTEAVLTQQENSGMARDEPQRALYEARLEDLRQLLEKHSIGLSMALYPAHLTLLNLRPRALLDWVDATAAELGIASYDLGETLGSMDNIESLYLLPHDGHPSPLGYRVSARALAEWLRREPSFAARCRGN